LGTNRFNETSAKILARRFFHGGYRGSRAVPINPDGTELLAKKFKVPECHLGIRAGERQSRELFPRSDNQRINHNPRIPRALHNRHGGDRRMRMSRGGKQKEKAGESTPADHRKKMNLA